MVNYMILILMHPVTAVFK